MLLFSMELERKAYMQRSFLKIPNKIIMNIDPQLNKNEFLVCLILVDRFMFDFNKKTIVLMSGEITKHEIATNTISRNTNEIMSALSGRKALYDRAKKSMSVIFEKIEKIGLEYHVTISEDIRKIFNNKNGFCFIYFDIINKLNKYKAIKFYCLMRVWHNKVNVYLTWLRWYLSIENIDTSHIFKLYINDYIKQLMSFGLLIKVVKHADCDDRRKIKKLTFEIFDTIDGV